MNFSSDLKFLVSTRALYFHVNKNYFYAVLSFFIIFIVITEALYTDIAFCLSFLLFGSYISKGNPDFFDVYIESIRFAGLNKLHPTAHLSLFKVKTNGVRKWEA